MSPHLKQLGLEIVLEQDNCYHHIDVNDINVGFAMAQAITIRQIDSRLHDALRMRAAESGRSVDGCRVERYESGLL
jgi:hypothetical protein